MDRTITGPIEYAPLLPVAAIAACGLVAALLVLRAYLRPGRAVAWTWRAGMLLLRLAALGVVLGCLLGPSRVERTIHADRAPVVLLLDDSRSMSLADQPGAPTRANRMNDALESNRGRLEALAMRFDVRFFRAGTAAVEGPLGPVACDQPKTALGDALDSALRAARGRRNGAVILLTDGVSNSGREPSRVLPRFRAAGLPIYAVGFGEEAGPAGQKDLKVTNLLAPKAAILHATVPVIAECSLAGYQGKKVLAHFRVDSREVLTKWVFLQRDRENVRLTFHLPCEVPGQRKVTVAFDVEPDELDAKNNELSTFVDVDAQNLPILYVEGTPRWEAKFLRRTLESIEGVNLDYVNAMSGDSTLLSQKDFAQFRIVILGDLPAKLFPRADQERMAKAVADVGVGLVMTGGIANFGPGGYADTPVGRILPVRMTARDGAITESFYATPTPQGLQHPACQIADDLNACQAAWAMLAKLDGATGVAGLQPAATMLMKTSNHDPLLVEQPVGKGRTTAFLADTTWKWAMGDEKSLAAYRRFWKQLVLSLAQKDLKTGRRLWATLDRYLYVPGETVQIQVFAQTEEGKPLREAGLTAAVVYPNGSRAPISPSFFGECHHATIVPDAGGEYLVEVEGTDGETSLGKYQTKFFVRAADFEMDSPEADLPFLHRAARETGGRYVEPERLGDLLEMLKGRPAESVVEEERRSELWNRPSVIFLFAALLTLEWVLRRLKRLL